MNIEVAGIKITFGTVAELNDALKKNIAQLDRDISDHETKSMNMRKIRKEMLRAIGGQPDAAKSTHGASVGV